MDEGAAGEICSTVESVNIVSVYSRFQNGTINVTVSNKCCDSFKCVFIKNLQSPALIVNGNGW